MPTDDPGSRVTTVAGPDAELVAAVIWAPATDVRDGLVQGRSPTVLLPDLRAAAARPGAVLLHARAGERVTGFALVVPQTSGLELLYLAVDPDDWGGGVAARLLDSVRTRASEACLDIVLWVIEDNDRARAAYARAGWIEGGQRRQRDDGRAEVLLGLPRDLRTGSPRRPRP